MIGTIILAFCLVVLLVSSFVYFVRAAIIACFIDGDIGDGLLCLFAIILTVGFILVICGI